MFERVILTPCIDMLRKVVCGQKAMILFLCFEAEIQFKKPIVLLKQFESLLAVKYLCKSFITLLLPEHNSLFGCDIVCQQCPIDSGLHWTTNVLTNCVYHNIMMFFYVFWGVDFKNGIKNFVMSMILPLFQIS